MKTVKTFTATIYCGSKIRYSGKLFSLGFIEKICQRYVDSVGLCVTVTQTKFIYTEGNEPGVIVGLINYPRFPSTPRKIKAHAFKLAKLLKGGCKQLKVSIVFPNETVMLSD